MAEDEGERSPLHAWHVEHGADLMSPAVSPRVGTIGLAILDSDVAAEGTAVEVAVGDGTASAIVEPLSILDPNKERPRG